MGSIWRFLLIAAGIACTGIGIVGIILPGVPGTVFLIMAAALFARASPRFESWLLTHRTLGPPVVRWRERGAISPRIKLIAIGSMLASGLVVAVTAPTVAALATAACLLPCAIYVGSRPNE